MRAVSLLAVLVAQLPLVAVVAPAALWTPSAVAGELVEDKDAVGENIVAEADALRELATAVRLEVDSGALTLSPEAAGKWAEGKAAWDEIAEIGRAGRYGDAYRAARRARGLVREAFRASFTDSPSAKVVAALLAYEEAVRPRVDALENQMKHFTPTEAAREAWQVGRALQKDAAKSWKKKQYDTAFRQLTDGLNEFDKVVYEVYPAAR